MSEIKYNNGKYHKKCLFDLCTEDAVGRIDKRFCSAKCKNAYHNLKNAEVRKKTKGYDTKLLRANRILMRMYKVNHSSGAFVTTQIELSKNNFPFDLPTTPMKDDRYTYEFHNFGSFAFYKEKDKYLFIKVEK
jgi:hypothetical protein